MKQYAPSLDLTSASTQEPLTATDAWVSGLMFQQAVKLSGVTGIPTSADIVAGLEKFKNETLGGMSIGACLRQPYEQRPRAASSPSRSRARKFTLPNGTYPDVPPRPPSRADGPRQRTPHPVSWTAERAFQGGSVAAGKRCASS